MTITSVTKIDEWRSVNHVLISVSDKAGLEMLVPKLLDINPSINIFSTGGTFARIKEIIGSDRRLIQVSDYTDQPETQGGLVKTLDFKIYLGLLTETYNPSHQADLERTGSLAIDMVIVNLYPFKSVINEPNSTFEMARGHIDIGGPCMLRAAAKNFLRVAALCDPRDYPGIIRELKAGGGKTSFGKRYTLAKKAFRHVHRYDGAIVKYLSRKTLQAARNSYPNGHKA